MFLDLAAEQLGVSADVGFGKIILLYPQKTTVNASAMTATAINAAIEAGTIIGVVKNWHTVAGAPVAETNVERPGTAEMKIIRQEILADTLSFESNICNRAVIKDLVSVGTIQGVLLDDRGNVFGEPSTILNTVKTMALNFTGKTSTSLQKDNTSDKMVSVTVRYLVDDIAMLDAGVEVEEVGGKVQVMGQFVSGEIIDQGEAILLIKIINKCTQKVFVGGIVNGEIFVRSNKEVLSVDNAALSEGVLQLSISNNTVQFGGSEVFFVTISGDECYMKETKFVVSA